MRIRSIAMRIWLTIAVFICSIVLVFLFVFAFVLKDDDEAGSRHLFEFSHAVVLNDLKGNTRNESLLGSFDREPITHFVYHRKDGQFTFIAGQSSKIDPALIQEGIALLGNEDNMVFTKRIDYRSYLVQISKVEDQTLFISYQPIAFNEDMKQIIIAGILIILFSLPISKLIANNIGKPLRQLEGYTKRIANKDWDSELAIERKDEIGRLAHSMKEMKEALRIADQEERKFLQSISHDLKTPVMIIASYAQAIIDGMYVGSAEEPSSIIKAEAVRLEKKIKQILFLNTLDYMLENDKDKEEVRLDKLLSYLVGNLKTVNTDLTWELRLESRSAELSGSPDRIRVAIENVLENQLRFARTIVVVILRDSGTYWTIEVRNDGPLLTEDELNQLFHSLFKGVKGNFGLGLSISSKIVDFYGGTLDARNQDGYVCFTIRFAKN